MATFIINNENIYNLVRKYFNGDITIPPLSEWNTSNVTNMARLFQNITFNNNDPNQNISPSLRSSPFIMYFLRKYIIKR